MKKFLLNLYFWPAFAVVSLISILIVLPLVLAAGLLTPGVSTGRILRKGVRIYGWVLVRVVPFMAPVTVEDRSGGITTPAIFTPNHNSSVDPYLFGMLPYEMAFVTTWPFKIPIYNFVMRLARYINANMGWEFVRDQGAELIQSGCSLIIWPEGHRSRDGRLRRFKNGAFQMALEYGCPVVPVCISGSFHLLPPGSRFLSPARVKMVILPPVEPSGSAENPEDIRALKLEVASKISQELERIKHQRQENAIPVHEMKTYSGPGISTDSNG